MQRSRTALFELLSAQDEQAIQTQAQTFDTFDATFRQETERLSGLVAQGHLSLDLQPVVQAHQQFVTQAKEELNAQAMKIAKEATARQSFASFEQQSQALDALLADLISKCETARPC